MRLLERVAVIADAGAMVLPRVLTDGECRHLIEELQRDPGAPATSSIVGDPHHEPVVQPNLNSSLCSDGSSTANALVTGAVQRVQGKLERFFEKPLDLSPELHFRTYRSGDFIVPHVDQLPGAPARISEREVVFSLLLNADYEGGEIVIHADDREFALQPKAGKMLAFGGHTIHSVRAVTTGTRYSITGWFRGVSGPR